MGGGEAGVENLTKTQKFSPKQVLSDKYFLLTLSRLSLCMKVAQLYIYIYQKFSPKTKYFLLSPLGKL